MKKIMSSYASKKVDKFKNLNDEELKIYKSSIFLPFGRYNSAEKSPESTSEVYVGHEKQRTSFLRHILNSGKSCAYLITGQRGAGKTNFVNHCLREYDSSVAARYQNYKVERSSIDVFFTSIFFTFIVCIPGWFSQLLPVDYHEFYAWVFLTFSFLLSYSVLKPTLNNARLLDRIWLKPSIIAEKDRTRSGAFIEEECLKNILINKCVLTFIKLVITGLALLFFCFAITIYGFGFSNVAQDYETLNQLLGLGWHYFETQNYNGEIKARFLCLIVFLIMISFPFFIVFLKSNLIKFGFLKRDSIDPKEINELKFKLVIWNFYYIFINSVMENQEYNEFYNSLLFTGYATIIAIALYLTVKLERKYIVNVSQKFNDIESLADLDSVDFAFFRVNVNNKDDELRKLKQYYKLLSKSTWVSWYFNLWSPHIKVNVNLGFDDISHKNIVFTLLTEIRHKYFNHFVSWRSLIGFFQRVFLLSLIFVVYISFRILYPQIFDDLGNFVGIDEPIQSGLILCVGFLLMYGLTTYVIPVLPYKANLKRMDFILDRLTSVLTDEQGLSEKGLNFKKSKVFQPLSSRDIEYQFLSIINMIRDNRYSFFGQFIQIPEPISTG